MDLLEPRVQPRQRLREPVVLGLAQGLGVLTQSRISTGTWVQSGGCMPPGKGSMSCSRNEPGRSFAVAWGCGATSQTGVIASEWTSRSSERVINLPPLQPSGSIPCP